MRTTASSSPPRRRLPRPDPHTLRLAAALLVVYVVWGSTYLGIRVMVDDEAGGGVPPMFATCARFALAAVLLAGWIVARRGLRAFVVPRAELVGAAVIGTLLLVGGTGLVNVAERDVPSGLTAVVVGAVPLIVIALRALTGERVSGVTIASVVVGFVGLALLMSPGARLDGVPIAGMLAVILACLFWSVGSFWSNRVRLPADQLVSATLQMGIAAVVTALIGVATGEPAALPDATFDAPVLLALAYLVVFGSILAFSTFTWLLRNAPMSTVATYAYVNPVVALALGWSLLGERVTLPLLGVSGLVIGSVALTVWWEGRQRPRQEAAAVT